MDQGRILGQLEEFKAGATKSFDRIELRFDKIDGKMDTLFQFRWQLIGMSSVVSVIVAAVATFLDQWLRHP